ncbi:MAG: hypothetical protein V3573_13075 [Desulfovibrionaceae bacterium]
MVKSANHGGIRKIQVKTAQGMSELSFPTLPTPSKSDKLANLKIADRFDEIHHASCGCLCTPASSASLLTTEK